MRKLIAVGMLVGGLLGLAGPSMAQGQGGIGDPLTLAASGVLMPFFGEAGDAALLEVASPVGDNSGLHMFFFDASCSRVGDSVFLPLTVNDIAHLQVTGTGGVLTPLGFFGANPKDGGLITIANSDDGFTLDPLKAPVHSRMYLFNGTTGRSRIVEPIILDTYEFSGNPHTWSPLRTSATFFAPQDGGGISTKLWLICPQVSIQAAGYFHTSRFLQVSPGLSDNDASDILRAVVFDTDEKPLVDVHTPCDCVRTVGNIVTGISTVYSSPGAAHGTFTKIETDPDSTNSKAFPFTGYRSTSTGAVNDFFGRISNGSRYNIDGRNPSLGATDAR